MVINKLKIIKLRKCNQYKVCPKGCVDEFAPKGLVKIDMLGLSGFCPVCREKLYSIDTRGDVRLKK